MFARKAILKVTAEALEKFDAQVAEYLRDHPNLKRREVSDFFGISLGYVDKVIFNHNIQRRRGRPTKREK